MGWGRQAIARIKDSIYKACQKMYLNWPDKMLRQEMHGCFEINSMF